MVYDEEAEGERYGVTPGCTGLVFVDAVYDAMVSTCVGAIPKEACGFLAGRMEGSIAYATMHYPVLNVADDPTAYFEMHRGQQARAVHDATARRLRILALYHSHPTTGAVPSTHDIELAPDHALLHVIVGLARSWSGRGKDPEPAEDVRVFRINSRRKQAVGVRWQRYGEQKADWRRFHLG